MANSIANPGMVGRCERAPARFPPTAFTAPQRPTSWMETANAR
jgi:hypothetical protein